MRLAPTRCITRSMMARILSVRLDPEMARRLEAAADEERKSKSELVREAILARVGTKSAGPPRVIDVVADRIGCFDSGRTDLSTRGPDIIRERLRARRSRSR